MNKSVLIVEDDPLQKKVLETQVLRCGYKVTIVGSVNEALDEIDNARVPDVILLDLLLPQKNGYEFFKEMRDIGVDIPVVVMTANSSVEIAVDAMRCGAIDFLTKPIAQERLEVSLRNAIRLAGMQHEVAKINKRATDTNDTLTLIAEDVEVINIIKQAKKAATSKVPILIDGESGTGKEVLARMIHTESDRCDKPMIAVNCGAIPENLVESILFGHEKGSFTGASDTHKGKFQEASGGTIFLDEIGELRQDVQVKLLRALQQGEIERVGSNKPLKVDVRLISATNRNLAALVREGKFREDLYYRINVLRLTLPPLRDRRGDIITLANHFIKKIAEREKLPINGLTERAQKAITSYGWPGNIRQLENTLFRAAVIAENEMIDIGDLPEAITGITINRQAEQSTHLPLLDVAGNVRLWSEIERDAAKYLLALCDGDLNKASSLTGLAVDRFPQLMPEEAARIYRRRREDRFL